MTGTTVSHYNILEKLGEGGMGVVYKAHDTKLDRIVALKFLPAHLSSSEDEKTRFLQEAKAAASLSHPNICTIYAIEEYTEAGGSDSRFFFAMEYLEGRTLRHAMKEISLQRTLDIGFQVAEGLGAAHQKGIVHRDVKAENIMARPDGRVQVMDFGLAKVRGGSQLTKAGSTVGTIGYMAPEQIQGMDVDHRADLFSLGVLLYEMASGHLPFRGVHDAAVMYEIVNVQPPTPSEVNSEIPDELDRIILKCLAKDREERYQSARDVAVDLKMLKKRSGSGVITAMPGQAVSPGRASGSREAIPRPATGSEPAGTSNRKPMVYALAALLVLLGAASAWYFLGRGPSAAITSMVVLPFENVGNDPDLEYLSDGVTEGIINKMSRMPGLRVIPRSAAFRFKGSSKDPKSIGEELGVDAVLSGRVVQRADKLDLTLELIDVRAYAQLWGESYKRTMNELITVQEEIVGEVSAVIAPGAAARPDRAAIAGTTGTKDPAAYRLYLQGKFHWNKRTAADFERALNYYNQAIAIDPGYARARLGLAETYILQAQYSDIRSSDVMALAEREAIRSTELDPSLGEAHAALGMIRESHWDWAGAEREFKLAIEKAPGYATSYHWYFIFLQLMGRDDEALAVIKKGAELDPYSPIILSNLANGYLTGDNYAAADEVIRKIKEIDPQFFFASVWGAAVCKGTGKSKEGLDILKGMKLQGLSSNNLGFVGHYYAAFGDAAMADSVLRMLLGDPNKKADPVAVAMVYAGIGKADSTMAWLQRAYDEEGKSRTLPMTGVWREFRLVEKDPRLIALMKKIGVM